MSGPQNRTFELLDCYTLKQLHLSLELQADSTRYLENELYKSGIFMVFKNRNIGVCLIFLPVQKMGGFCLKKPKF